LFDFFQNGGINKEFMIFNTIENAVINKSVDAGVIIHENRFTYFEKGLKKVIDLGEFWESQTMLPIPLGGIVAKKEMGYEMAQTVSNLIKESLLFAYKHPEKLWPYIKKHAQEMEEDVIKSHIKLYVNEFSVELGEVGHAAIKKMKEMIQLS
jgi:1,4-dihydroxy-6-naphthoate synthase